MSKWMVEKLDVNMAWMEALMSKRIEERMNK